MTYLKRIIYSFSILFILLASLLVFFFTTTPGLYTGIKLVNLYLPGKIHVHKGTGSLINHFTVKEITYIDDNVLVQITMGVVDWQLKTLLHHQLIPTLSADNVLVKIHESSHFNLRMPKLPFKLLIHKLTINKLQVQYIGGMKYFHNVELQASLNHPQWIINSFKARTTNFIFNLRANGRAASPYPATATLQFSPLNRPMKGLQGILNFEGDLALYHWQGQFNGPIQGSLRGSLKNGLELQTNADWHINSFHTLTSSQGHLSINGRFSDFMISADTRINSPISAEWQLTARIKNKHTEVNSSLQFPTSNLKTALTLKGTLYDSQHGNLTFSINPGTYQLPTSSPVPAIPFKGGDLLVNITPEALQANGTLAIDQHKSINVALRIPKFRLTEIATTKQPIDGKVSLQINSLDFLHGLSKAIETIRGQLQMNLTANGTLAKPVLNGELLLTNGSLSMPKFGLSFQPIQAKLLTRNKQWQVQGSITSQDHLIALKGRGDFSPQMTGQLKMDGDNFPAIKTANYTINISPQLAINFRPNTIDITGSILVPTAQFKPISFSNTVSLSEDVVFVSKTATTANPFNISTDVQIKMGQDVALDVKGLHGYLDGAIRVQQAPQSAMSAIGDLTIRDGKYQAYGQDLIVDQGQLMFTGGPIDNPGIHIRAIRKFNNSNPNMENAAQSLNFSAANIDTIDVSSQTTVGIEMSGHLNAHKIKLFSIPANLAQSDILSMLLLGKPASQASQSGGQLLLAAISSMNLDSGTKGLQLLSQLKQSLGVDFNVQNNNTHYNQTTTQAGDNTSLVVSKSLTKRLYLSYNIGLLQNDSNVLTLKYLLNKFFSIQVTTSDSGNGLDILYTHGKD